MICPRCKNEIADTPFCPMCGKALRRAPSKKKRGNGQGTIVQRDGKYRAIITLGYYRDEKGQHRKTKLRTYATKKEAVAALVTLRAEKPDVVSPTLMDLYKVWEPTHKATASTIGCYQAAFKYLEDLWLERICDITVDDLQEAIDDCPKGKRTKENMRALLGLLYKYAVPRKMCEMNLAPFLKINAEGGTHRSGFTADQIKKISKSVGKITGADIIMCMIYTGFRPSEFLALKGKDYDRARGCLRGGSKTEAGRDRIVTVSPKIASMIPSVAPDEHLFSDLPLRTFTEKIFYPALEKIGIPNPLVDVGKGMTMHTYTPHSCRHTFATLMKSVPGADKDKLELIGHASSEMLRYYQDVGIEDLKKITDLL